MPSPCPPAISFTLLCLSIDRSQVRFCHGITSCADAAPDLALVWVLGRVAVVKNSRG